MRVIRPEFKMFGVDNVGNLGTFNGSTNVLIMSQILQGDGANERNGNRICVKGIYIRFTVEYNVASSLQYQPFRLQLVRDVTNGTGTSGLNGSTYMTGCTNADDVIAYMMPVQTKRYEIVKDSGVQFVANSHAYHPFVYYNTWYANPNKIIQYNASTGAGTDVTGNQYILVMYTTTDAATDDKPYFEYNIRVRYIDC